MPYSCKNCGLRVFKGYFKGVKVYSIETKDDNLRDVESCPDCGNRLMFDEVFMFTAPLPPVRAEQIGLYPLCYRWSVTGSNVKTACISTGRSALTEERQ